MDAYYIKSGTGVILSNTKKNIAVIEHPWHLLYIWHDDSFRQKLKHVTYKAIRPQIIILTT
jgi:hypothetical protein